MKHWSEVKLKGVSRKIEYGYTASAEAINSGVKFVRITDIASDYIDWDQVPYCQISDSDKAKYALENNDIVIARTGATVGYAKQIQRIPADAVFASYLIRVKLNDDVDKRFIGILIESSIYKEYIKTIAGGAAQPNANAQDLTSFPFYLPSLPIQNKIAAILSTYDDLIENNNRRIAILEKMAEELYREWFVRLRFPGHGKVKIVKGAPEGWEVKRICDLGRVVTGKTPPTSNRAYFDGQYPFIKTPDMHDNLFVIKTEETLAEEGIQYQKAQTLPPNSISVSCIGTGGVVAITSVTSQTNQQINSIILSEAHYREWAFFNLRNMKELIQLFGYTGSTMTNLSKGKFENLKFIMPPDVLLKAFHKMTEGMFDFVHILQTKSLKLTISRDRLLSRLMSSKIDVENMDIQSPASMQEELVHA